MAFGAAGSGRRTVASPRYVNSSLPRGPQYGQGMRTPPSMQVRLGARALFVEQRAGRGAIEPHCRGDIVRLVARDQMREAPAGGRCCLEAAVAPAAIEIEPVDRRAVDDRRA